MITNAGIFSLLLFLVILPAAAVVAAVFDHSAARRRRNASGMPPPSTTPGHGFPVITHPDAHGNITAIPVKPMDDQKPDFPH